MKLLKTVPAIVMLAGGMFASLNAAADDSVFTVMEDPASAKKPFEGNLNAVYLAQSGNTKTDFYLYIFICKILNKAPINHIVNFFTFR